MANEFNSQSVEHFRTSTVLKYKYENIKRTVKKMYADEKTFNRGTGGGPTKSFPGSLIATVEELLQTKMTGESAVFDSDSNVMWESSNLMDEENINDADILPEVIEYNLIYKK